MVEDKLSNVLESFNKLKKWCNACFAYYDRTGELRPSSYFGSTGKPPKIWNCTISGCSNHDGAGFSNKSHYTRHLQSHSDETFDCDNLGCSNNKQQGYKTKEALARHKKSCKFPPP